MRAVFYAAVVSIGLSMPSVTFGKTVELSYQFDLNTAFRKGPTFVDLRVPFGEETPFSLSDGDTFILNVSFLSGQRIRYLSPSNAGSSGVTMWMFGKGSGTWDYGTRVSVLNPSSSFGGNATYVEPSVGTTIENDFALLGARWFSDQSEPFTVDGFRFEMNFRKVDFTHVNPFPPSPRPFPSLIIEAGAAEISLPVAESVVPEPATWAMLIAGFGVVGMAARRRRTGAGSVVA